jgi:hypothetical protein
MDRRLLRISDVGYGHGPCNCFEENELCGKDAEWISSVGARKDPGTAEWEPLRYCRKHWMREVCRTAQRDQDDAAFRANGYPLGATLVSLVVHVGFCALQEQSHRKSVWATIMKVQRRDAIAWLRNWMRDYLKTTPGDIDMLAWHLNSFVEWLVRPADSTSPLIDDYLDGRVASDGFCAGLRAGIRFARELLEALSK